MVNHAGNEAAAAETVAAVRTRGAEAIALKADVSKEADVLALFAEADRHGALSGLVINAGIVAPLGRVETFSAERIERIMAVNVVGAILCAREGVKRLSTRHGGKGGPIVLMGSIAARIGSPGEFADYAASKGAIDSFTIGLAKEVGPEGVRVNAVRPGLIDTEIHAAAAGRGVRPRWARPCRSGAPARLTRWRTRWRG